MDKLISVLDSEQTACIQAEIENLVSTRRQLFHFVPSETNLIMKFTLAGGDQLEIPIQDQFKVRMLIREVREYLEQKEFLNERKLKTLHD